MKPALLAGLLFPAIAPNVLAGLPSVLSGVALDCRADIGGQPVAWKVELDPSLPLATVDDGDAPADYSESHAQIRLGISAPSLFIGLGTGRLLVSAADGRPVGQGLCVAGLSA